MTSGTINSAAFERTLSGARPLTGGIPEWSAALRPFRALAASLSIVLAGLGAWSIFGVLDRWLGWQASSLLALVYLTAIGALQALLIHRFSATYRRGETERLEALRLSAQRQTMLAEARHRIANNLATISAMLDLQGRELGDWVAQNAIEAAAGRIRVVAEIDRMFNRLSSDDARIDDAVVRDLISRCIAAAGAEERVRFETSIESIDLPRSAVLPVALVIGECVNNALTHGFPGSACGTIAIRLTAANDGRSRYRLIIDDDGLGPPEGFDSSEARSAGLIFVNSFARQIGGSFRLEGRFRGARSALTF